jgi:hypothetical protein
MIKRMIKAHPTENRMARGATLVVDHPSFDIQPLERRRLIRDLCAAEREAEAQDELLRESGALDSPEPPEPPAFEPDYPSPRTRHPTSPTTPDTPNDLVRD